jgi:glutamate racemase
LRHIAGLALRDSRFWPPNSDTRHDVLLAYPPQSPIGLFDSGVGGLTVLRELRAELPAENFHYVGDTARVPWGSKGAATVQRYSVEIARHLEQQGCKAIVIACHTASTYAMQAVRAAVTVPVFDVVGPVSRTIANDVSITRVGVLGTRGTVRSAAYAQTLSAMRPSLRVSQQACPLFVPLAEEGWLTGDVPERVVRHYLGPLFAEEVPDTLLLGCTHYPILSDVIARVARSLTTNLVNIVHTGPSTACALREALANSNKLGHTEGIGDVLFEVTDDPDRFCELGSTFLGEPIAHATLLPLQQIATPLT